MRLIWTLAAGIAAALAAPGAAQEVAPMPRPAALATVPQPDGDGLLDAAELGPMVVLLASPEGAGITGQVIGVDGGYRL